MDKVRLEREERAKYWWWYLGVSRDISMRVPSLKAFLTQPSRQALEINPQVCHVDS